MGLLAAAGIAVTTTTVLETVAVVGGVLSVAGAITKNPILSYVGMGLGIVGGIGALASSALGAAADVVGSTASSAADAAGATWDSATAGATASSVASDAASVAPDAVGGLSGASSTGGAGAWDAAMQTTADVSANAAAPVTSAASAPVVSAADAPVVDPATGAGTSGGAVGSDTAGAGGSGGTETTSGASGGSGPPTTSLLNGTPPTAAPPDPSAAINPNAPSPSGGDASLPIPDRAPGDLGAYNPATGKTITTGIDGTTGKLIGLPEQEDTSLLGKLTSYVAKNPTVGFGAAQGVASLLSGWTSTLTPAQVAALNAQAANNSAAANFTAQQTANLQQPRAVASSAPVTGAPAPLVPAGSAPGLINQAATPAVTGKVAA